MKVSILVPTLNRLPMLRESIESARAQTHRDLEILVSDDGSRDGTLEYLDELTRTDARVRLAPKNPEPGLFTNINHLVRNARGDAFCILADDDRLLPGFVERLALPLEQHPDVIAAFCDHWIIGQDGRQMHDASDANTHRWHRDELAEGPVGDAIASAVRGSMCMGFSLYRSSVFQQEPFDLTCGGAADFDYAMRAAQRGRLWYVPERLGEYRTHMGTTTATKTDYMLRGAIRAFEKHHFRDAAHEQLRLTSLRNAYMTHALFASTGDRRQWVRSARGFLSAGGRPWNPRFLLAAALALPPRALARRVKAAVKNLHLALGRYARGGA